jgi:hypothetical protein
MDFLLELWQAVAPYFANITISGIASAIIFGCLKGAFNKTISRINVEKIAENATEKGIETVKKVSFEQSIQPLAESELRKITEVANKYIETQLAEMKMYHMGMIAILEAQAKYFDNSIGVPDEAKAELKKAIEDAKEKAGIGTKKAQAIKIEEVIEVAKKEPKTAQIKAETTTKTIQVER